MNSDDKYKSDFTAYQFNRFYKFNRTYDFWSLPEAFKISNKNLSRKIFFCTHQLVASHEGIKLENVSHIQMVQYYVDFKGKTHNDEKYDTINRLKSNKHVYVCGFTTTFNIRFFVPVYHQTYTNKEKYFSTTPEEIIKIYHELYLDVLEYFRSECGIKYVKSESYNPLECVTGLLENEWFIDNSTTCVVYRCDSKINKIK